MKKIIVFLMTLSISIVSNILSLNPNAFKACQNHSEKSSCVINGERGFCQRYCVKFYRGCRELSKDFICLAGPILF